MNALRVAVRHGARAARPVAPISQGRLLRPFSSTPARRAYEDLDSFMAGFRNSPLFNRLAEEPEVLAALSKMAEFLKKSGIDMSTPPSSLTLFKLATNSEFRELTRNATEEIRKAGIDLRPEDAMELFSPPKDPKGTK
ncbi:hypothetical protein FRC06_004942 [Ceratobasidium sp. 370]|nr:hypothetical protein FRC06_004942 [Ceratobasidium sp. 370]